jgi:hypothetical protein
MEGGATPETMALPGWEQAELFRGLPQHRALERSKPISPFFFINIAGSKN